jgi:TRAP-type C4-dicarboxylate transport system substrate-binding protein
MRWWKGGNMRTVSMKKWKICLVFGIILFSLSLSVATAQSPQKVITWGFAPSSASATPGSSYHKYIMEPFADLINADTNGQLKLIIHKGLVPDNRVIEGVRDGTVDMGAQIVQFRAELALLGFIVLPFIPHEKLPEIAKQMKPAFSKLLSEKHDVVLLGYGYAPKQWLITKKPIRTVEDMKGYKIRVAATETLELLKAAGANPVFMPMSEVYPALQRGVIDGGITSLEGVVSKKWYEVLKYVYDWPVGNGSYIWFANKKSWATLPSDLQKQILKAFDDKYEMGTFEGTYEEDARYQRQLESFGMQFGKPEAREVEKYLANAPPILAKWKERVGSGADEMIAVINKVLGTNYK